MTAFKPVWSLLSHNSDELPYPPDNAPYPLLELVTGEPRKVLDIGCYCGGSGRWLKQKFPECQVIGIELSAAAAKHAAKDYDEVLVGSVENMDFPADKFADFDAIIAADVLEHLYNPWQLLQRLHPLLSASGALYVNLPNVRNLTHLALLAEGEWRYQKAGILDITHIRFFTRRQALEMLENTGWKAEDLQFLPDPSFAEQLESMNIEDIKNLEIGALRLDNLTPLDVLELLSVQFAIRAVPERD